MARPPLRHLPAFGHGVATGIGAAHRVAVLMGQGMFDGVDGGEIGRIRQGRRPGPEAMRGVLTLVPTL